jgi:hypothetical protein
LEEAPTAIAAAIAAIAAIAASAASAALLSASLHRFLKCRITWIGKSAATPERGKRREYRYDENEIHH